jgi:hypothetical protein
VFLYRALNRTEITLGNILVPKGQDPFVANPRLAIDTRLPFVLGKTEEYAVRQHQWKQNGFPTSGISTTPHFDRAKFYARQGVVVKIDRRALPNHGIREFSVKVWLCKFPEDIACPEDDEIILVGEQGQFPKEIIVEVFDFNSKGS